MTDTTLVVTSINEPTDAMRQLADGAKQHGIRFLVIGDTKSPATYELDGAEFMSVDDQVATGFEFAAACPTRHYGRKNIGYLAAMAGGAEVILETDDDNFPRPAFFESRERAVTAPAPHGAGWVNVYRYFAPDGDERLIWPRGFPLDLAAQELAPLGDSLEFDCPIQQGLADDDPDVDAVYRMVGSLPYNYAPGRAVVIPDGAWCPFNSQSTAWFADAFRAMYLPLHCSIRMTDIWRGLVAQRIAWANGWAVSFRSPDVYQVRNDHDLMVDFVDEIPGYLHNKELVERLGALDIAAGVGAMSDGVRTCWTLLVEMGLVGAEELPLLDAWLRDVDRVLA
jgi:hypothetical protein